MLNIKNLVQWSSLLILIAFVGCKDNDVQNSLAANFKELQYSYTGSTQKLLIRSTVPWTISCDQEWVEFDKTSGLGDDGTVSQHVNITTKHNGNPERKAIVNITGEGFIFKVNIIQEEGLVKINELYLTGNSIVVGEQIEGLYIAIPYSRTMGSEKLSAQITLSGSGAQGLTATTVSNATLKVDNGMVLAEIKGTPQAEGNVTFTLTPTIDANTYAPLEVKTEVLAGSRMDAPAKLKIYKTTSNELIMEWDNNRSVVRAKAWSWELRDGNTQDANIIYSMSYEVSKAQDGNKKYPYNRFIIGGLNASTQYYFKVKSRPSPSETVDAGKIESKWTNWISCPTASEFEVPSNAIIFQDFRKFAYGGNNIYTAWGAIPKDDEKTVLFGAQYGAHRTANEAAGNLYLTYSAAYRSSVGLDGWIGSSVYGATGMLKMGTGSAVGSLKTPTLNTLETDSEITVNFYACAWCETVDELPGDNPQMTLVITGAGTFANGTQTMSFDINTNAAIGRYEAKVSGANASTVIEFKSFRAAANRWFLDDILIVKGN